MAQTYTLKEKILLNYNKLPDGMDLSSMSYLESELVKEVSSIKTELNKLSLKPSKRCIDSVLAFSSAHHVADTENGQMELMLN